MKKFILFSLVILLGLTSCEIYRFNYDIVLDNVERIDKGFNSKCPKVFFDKHYEDKNIKATLTIDSLTKGINFMITNNTPYSIKVNYKDIMYSLNNEAMGYNSQYSINVNYSNFYSQLYSLSSVTYNLNKIPDYKIIPKGTYITDCFLFTQNTLFPIKFDYTQLDKEREYVRKKYVGSKIKLYMPIDANGITNEYVFTFKVKKVKIMRYLKTL